MSYGLKQACADLTKRCINEQMDPPTI